ncbi:peptidoglycan D,D-transpeptidase FtsI family protein [Clostridium guangxiense]|uniref:peptidoglycan D,D-transpeptidase FtsI family protein n=1 Tax=Clostridium guangxiense TaxID=1662055 RepID=UPI001E4ACD87|nr:penicillin-binding transpeptidase domain-containing protein [Clostridium guangxiense]MCD2345302.1 penicillin-binding protein [Clostridium guangxiense]
MKDKKKSFFNRFTALTFIVFIVAIAICVKLVILQVVRADEYKSQANTKSHKFIKETAARGEITDSKGRKLATNNQSYNITYMETDTNEKSFYTTIAKVFYLLNRCGENKNDDFPIKVTPDYYFDFNTTDEDEVKADKISFLSKRGIKANIIKNLYGDIKWNKLTKAQQANVNKYTLKVSAKYVFDKLKKTYKIPNSYSFTIDGKTVNKKCTLEDTRKFMVEKDAVQMQSYSGYKPVDIASNIKKETAITFLQKLNELPGINVEEKPIRYYPYEKLASNAIGYIGKISTSSDDESDSYTERGYDVSSDLIGISGLESAEEDRLKGTAGGRVVEVDKSGRVINEFASKDSYAGQNIKTTLNADVQYTAEQALEKSMQNLRESPGNGTNGSYTGNATRGAAVAIDVNTGGVIALAQSPNFNPNDFADPNGISDAVKKKNFPTVEDQIKNLKIPSDLIDTLFPVDKTTGKRTDPYDYLPKPMYDYPTMGLTPPGSTFKMLTAIAGLETKTIDPSFTIEDNGHYDDGNNDKRDFTKSDGALGTLDLVHAIAKSSNPYFMTVSELLRKASGYDILAKYAWEFGLGVQPNSEVNPSTGIEIKENFGQTFNTYSTRSNLGQQAAWEIMNDLKNKAYDKKAQSIDLHTNSSDNSSIGSLKSEIKQKIRDYVINAKFDKKEFSDVLSKFAQSSGITISDSSMTAIVSGAKSVVEHAISSGATPYNIHNAAIGQGYDNYTMVQLANYIATIANGGKRLKVHLVDEITDPITKSVVFKCDPQVIKDTHISKYTLDKVKEGMALVNSEGTAAGKFDGLPFTTAGKTGTADAFELNFQEKIRRSSYAVYVGFAPVENPKIAVATVIYDGGFGNQITNVARAIYESYFKNVEKMTGVPEDVIGSTTAKPEVDSMQSNNASSR